MHQYWLSSSQIIGVYTLKILSLSSLKFDSILTGNVKEKSILGFGDLGCYNKTRECISMR